MRYALPFTLLSFALVLSGQAFAADIDWSKVDAALGKTASVQGEIRRYGIPRSDLQVIVDGVTIKPALALGGWLAFEPMADGALVMGDLVLTEPEIEPVMMKLLENGIDVTALHNHLLRGSLRPTTCTFMGMVILSPWRRPFARPSRRAGRHSGRPRRPRRKPRRLNSRRAPWTVRLA